VENTALPLEGPGTKEAASFPVGGCGVPLIRSLLSSREIGPACAGQRIARTRDRKMRVSTGPFLVLMEPRHPLGLVASGPSWRAPQLTFPTMSQRGERFRDLV
jgi:hypothetical protein